MHAPQARTFLVASVLLEVLKQFDPMESENLDNLQPGVTTHCSVVCLNNDIAVLWQLSEKLT